MKTTYTRTLFVEDLTKATFKLYITEEPKWIAKEEQEVKYTGVKSWTIITGEDATVLEEDYIGDSEMFDELHEYLILNFENGDTATFRNSHVDMFIRG